MKIAFLRKLMLLDALLLLFLGALLVFAPRHIQATFHFSGLPRGVDYMLGLWGCVFLSLALGYFLASFDPIRNLLWIQAGIARGVLETILGLVYLQRGIVTFPQAGFGIIVAALFTIAYLAFYPRTLETSASNANPGT